MKTKLVITGIAFFAIANMAISQDATPRGQKLSNGTGRGPAYVDNNKNSICDNFENGTPGGPRCQGNANFKGRGPGQGYRWGQNSRGPGYGRGQGYGRGYGRGRNFVDADKNGICDYYETVVKK